MTKNKIGILLRMQLLGSFGINKLLHAKKKDKIRSVGVTAVIAALLFVFVEGFICLYASLFSALAYETGAADIYMPAIFLLLSVFMFCMTVMTVGSRVFGARDYEMTVSLPVGTKQIAAAKILFVYLENLVIAVLFAVPFWAFGGTLGFSVQTHICIFLLLIFLPLLPTTLAVFAGTLIAVVTAKLKRKELIQSIFFIAVAAILFAIPLLTMRSGTAAQPVAVPEWLLVPFEKIWAAAAYCGANLLLFVLPCLFVGKCYTKINTMILSRRAGGSYKKKELKRSGKFRALLVKEIKRLFTCPEYAMNTLFGAVLVIVFPAVILALQGASLGNLQTAGGYGSVIVPFVTGIALFASMMPTTYCAVSLEGKNLWILRAAPLDASVVLWSKVAVNVFVETLPSVIAVAIYGGIMGMGFFYIAMSVIAVGAFSCAFAVTGLLINLRFPALEWEKEIVPVKRSRACLFVMLADVAVIAAVIITGFLLAPVNAWISSVYLVLLGAAYLTLTAFLLETTGKKLYDKLIS